MRPIRKSVVTDESMRPIAVQIDYADWLEIERLLDLRSDDGKKLDVSRFVGVMALDEEPLEYQARVRGEWS